MARRSAALSVRRSRRGGGSSRGVVLVVAGYRRIGHPERATRSSAVARHRRLRAGARRERRARGAAPLPAAARRCRSAPGGALGDIVGSGAVARFSASTARRCFLLALFAVGLVAVLRHVVAEADGAHRRGHRAAGRAGCGAARDERTRPRARRAGARRARSGRAGEARRRSSTSRCVVVPPAVDVPKSERVVKEKQRPLFVDMPDSPLPPLALLDDAPSAQEIGERRDARIHVAPDRAQARRLRRRRARARRVSRAR